MDLTEFCPLEGFLQNLQENPILMIPVGIAIGIIVFIINRIGGENY